MCTLLAFRKEERIRSEFCRWVSFRCDLHVIHIYIHSNATLKVTHLPFIISVTLLLIYWWKKSWVFLNSLFPGALLFSSPLITFVFIPLVPGEKDVNTPNADDRIDGCIFIYILGPPVIYYSISFLMITFSPIIIIMMIIILMICTIPFFTHHSPPFFYFPFLLVTPWIPPRLIIIWSPYVCSFPLLMGHRNHSPPLSHLMFSGL